MCMCVGIRYIHGCLFCGWATWLVGGEGVAEPVLHRPALTVSKQRCQLQALGVNVQLSTRCLQDRATLAAANTLYVAQVRRHEQDGFRCECVWGMAMTLGLQACGLTHLWTSGHPMQTPTKLTPGLAAGSAPFEHLWSSRGSGTALGVSKSTSRAAVGCVLQLRITKLPR